MLLKRYTRVNHLMPEPHLIDSVSSCMETNVMEKSRFGAIIFAVIFTTAIVLLLR